MTQHAHTTRVKGCYRCELGADEAFDDITTTSRLRQASITVDAEARANHERAALTPQEGEG